MHAPIRTFEESKELQLLRLCTLTLDDVKELNHFFFLHIKFEKSKLLTSHLRAISLLFDKVLNNMYSTGIKSCLQVVIGVMRTEMKQMSIPCTRDALSRHNKQCCRQVLHQLEKHQLCSA